MYEGESMDRTIGTDAGLGPAKGQLAYRAVYPAACGARSLRDCLPHNLRYGAGQNWHAGGVQPCDVDAAITHHIDAKVFAQAQHPGPGQAQARFL